MNDSRLTRTGWSALPTLGPMGLTYSNGDLTSNVLVFTGITCDTFDVLYTDWSNTGYADIEVDIDNAGTWADSAVTAKTGDQAMKRASFTIAGTLGPHTIKVRSKTNARLWVGGIVAYKGTSGAVIHNVSVSGAAWWSSATPTMNKIWSDTALSPHLVILALSTNDMSASSPRHTITTNVDDCITKIKALTGKGACDILGVLGHGYRNNESALQDAQNVIKTRYDIAGVPYLDIRSWWISNQQATADGRTSDGIHPSEKGHRDMAAAIYRTLTAA